MAIVHVSDTARDAANDAIVDLIDGGSGAGVLKIYTGTMPASPGTTATGTLLVTLTLSDPAFGDSTAGVVEINGVTANTAGNSGTAGYGRFEDSTGNGVLDVDVGTSGNALILSVNGTATASIGEDDTVDVTTGSFTFPSGA